MEKGIQSPRIAGNFSKPLIAALLLAFFIIMIWVAIMFLPPAVDWHSAFRPAARAYLSLQSPYNIERYVSPPWTAILLIPFAVFPEQVGRVLQFVVAILMLSFIIKRLGGSLFSTVIFLLSPPIMHMLLNGNLEWIALSGLIMPPQIGLFFILIKPQVGIGIAIFWLVEAFRGGGFKQVIYTFAPITIVSLLFMIPFGFWPNHFWYSYTIAYWNASLWPASIPVGLVLLAHAIRNRTFKPALAAGPCLSPYVLLHSWSAALLAIIPSTIELTVAVIGLWIVALMQL